MNISYLLLGVFFALLFWFIADMSYALRRSKKRAELSIRGEWKALNVHFENELKCRRPMLLLFERLVTPGLLEAQYALHLSNQGDEDRALALVERAVAKASRRMPTWGTFVSKQAQNRQMTVITRGHILCRMGYYAEALESLALAKSLDASSPMPQLIEGIVYFYQGNLKTAIRCVEPAINTQKANDAVRVLLCEAKSLNGRFQEAIDVMNYEPANVTAFFSREQLEMMLSDHESREVVLAMDLEVGGIFQPLQFLGIANVCLQAGDVQSMEASLDSVETGLGGHPQVRQLYHRLRACCWAMKGDGVKAEKHLSQARTLTEEFPSRTFRHEMHGTAGRVALLLGSYEEAHSQYLLSLESALHPLEKHVTRYWLGRSAEACGRTDEAASLFSLVANESFDTWMSADAANRLKRIPTAN